MQLLTLTAIFVECFHFFFEEKKNSLKIHLLIMENKSQFVIQLKRSVTKLINGPYEKKLQVVLLVSYGGESRKLSTVHGIKNCEISKLQEKSAKLIHLPYKKTSVSLKSTMSRGMKTWQRIVQGKS